MAFACVQEDAERSRLVLNSLSMFAYTLVFESLHEAAMMCSYQ